MLSIQLVSSQSPGQPESQRLGLNIIIIMIIIVFLVHPESITAIDGTTVQFSCTANNTGNLGYRVNDTAASLSSVTSKGFTQMDVEELGSMVLKRNLSVSVSSLYNNTDILCEADGAPDIDSNTAILTVQGILIIVNVLHMVLLLYYHTGPLSSVGDLSYSFINSSTVNITWSPPFTLPGTNIIGYNISVAINGSNSTEVFTSDNYYILSLTDSSCDQISITVSGYNGLDGDTNTIRGLF